MPHQCLGCDKVYDNTSNAILKGCPECGRKAFLYIKTMPERVGVSNYPPFETLKTLIKRNKFFSIPENIDMNTNIHYLKKDSGINWHNDGGATYGATFYLNKRWNRHWGGEFMFTDEKGHGWLPVVGNSLILVKSPLEHKVNTVLSPLIPRISIQLFMKASTS